MSLLQNFDRDAINYNSQLPWAQALGTIISLRTKCKYEGKTWIFIFWGVHT